MVALDSPTFGSKRTIVLHLTLNCIRWWGSSSGDMGRIEYPFIAEPSRLRRKNTPTASLQRDKTLKWVSQISYETIWCWGSSNTGALGGANTSPLPSLPIPLWPWSGSTYRVLSMDQIERLDIKSGCKQMTCKIELFEIELFDHLTVRTQMTAV